MAASSFTWRRVRGSVALSIHTSVMPCEWHPTDNALSYSEGGSFRIGRRPAAIIYQCWKL